MQLSISLKRRFRESEEAVKPSSKKSVQIYLQRGDACCSSQACTDSTMEPDREIARSPAFLCKGFLLSVSMFAGFFGVFFSIWKDMYNAVPSFLCLEITSIILLNLYVYHMKGTLFTKFNRARLTCLLVCASLVFVATLAYAVFLLVSAIRQEEEFSIKHNGSYFAFVPCLIANLWSALIIYETRRFIGMFDEQYGGGSSLPYRLN